MSKRLLIVDTETSGLSVESGDRLIEIGIVEVIDRKVTGRTFHQYVDPGFEIPEEAVAVHGLTRENVISLGNGQRFVDIIDDMLEFINGDELVIHNASFDMGFLDYELVANRRTKLSEQCRVFDTLSYAGTLFPGARNNLDALCKRFGVDTSARTTHGALLDATLLADVYIALTRHQVKLDFDGKEDLAYIESHRALVEQVARIDIPDDLPVIKAGASEIKQHNALIQKLAEKSSNTPNWTSQEVPAPARIPAPF